MLYSSTKYLGKIICFRNVKFFSTTNFYYEKQKHQLVIVGGGAGGITMAAKFVSKFGKNQVAVVEPTDVHYYQPYWTLVGGGIKKVENSVKPMLSVIPERVKWIKDSVVKFDPGNNAVITKSGDEISYDFLIIAMGLKLDYHKIKGFPEAFQTPGVCSNYTIDTVIKTPEAIKEFRAGNAIFTQPPNPIKCPGAPQKIAYLTDSNFRKAGKRDKAEIHFFTALNVIFSAPKYAESLMEVAKDRNIAVHFQHNLIEIKPNTKEAIFEKLDSKSSPKETITVKYEMIHVVPPMAPQEPLSNSNLCDSTGYLDVDKHTLQHNKFFNIFGIGDCTNVPTPKTAAAVAAQSATVKYNLMAAMNEKPLLKNYNGYTSCPLVTSHSRCIMAEFDYDLQPVETFPFNQGVERRSMFHLTSDVIPAVYWKLLLKGYWDGPKFLRKVFHLNMAR